MLTTIFCLVVCIFAFFQFLIGLVPTGHALASALVLLLAAIGFGLFYLSNRDN